jgi:uncharacterized protein YneF (UPF0154 family)
MWWLLGVVCALAMGVAISEYLAVRQIEKRIRRKWRDHEQDKR